MKRRINSLSYFGVHNHTDRSNIRLLDCINRPKALIDKAIELGLSGIAITDHECLSGHIKANKYAREIQKEHPDFKVALGNEIYLTDTRENGQKYYHFLLIAKDAIGHKALRELSSTAWYGSYVDRKMERVPLLKSEMKEIMSKYKGHVVATTACMGGELSTLALEKYNLDSINQSSQHIAQKMLEFTNYCKNDCFYCGIRRDNKDITRYRLTKEEIISCCKIGYPLGFRTFVLQSGEDPYYTDECLVEIVSEIHRRFPDVAITLSIGERTKESYESLWEAGTDRYLLRHETANKDHYEKLHPEQMSFDNRMECLTNLKEIGYQVGAGFMVGSPYQTASNLADDMLFIKELNPQMVGIGPFIPHKDTEFSKEPAGTLELTLYMLGLLRLMLPKVLLPATTALGTIAENGRELGILAGANVVMPNLSPASVREKYLLYDNKICTGDEAAESVEHLKEQMRHIGYEIVISRGDSLNKGGNKDV